MAHKKAAGSAKNLRDSKPKYRGVKVFGGQTVSAGNIIIRQKGSKYECGLNTYETRDFTIHAEIDGIVAFKKKNFKKFNGRTYLKTVVEVFPVGDASLVGKTSLQTDQSPASKAPTKPSTKKASSPQTQTKKTPASKAPTKPVAKKASSPQAQTKKTPASKAPTKPSTKKVTPSKTPAKKETKKSA